MNNSCVSPQRAWMEPAGRQSGTQESVIWSRMWCQLEARYRRVWNREVGGTCWVVPTESWSQVTGLKGDHEWAVRPRARGSSGPISRGGHCFPPCYRCLTGMRAQCSQIFLFYGKSLDFYVVAFIFKKPPSFSNKMCLWANSAHRAPIWEPCSCVFMCFLQFPHGQMGSSILGSKTKALNFHFSEGISGVVACPLSLLNIYQWSAPYTIMILLDCPWGQLFNSESPGQIFPKDVCSPPERTILKSCTESNHAHNTGTALLGLLPPHPQY